MKDSSKFVRIPYCQSCEEFVSEYEQTVQITSSEKCKVSVDSYEHKEAKKTENVYYLNAEAYDSSHDDYDDVGKPRCFSCDEDLDFLCVEPELAQRMLKEMKKMQNGRMKCVFSHEIKELNSVSDSEKEGIAQAKQLRKEILKALL